jgi:hypothetical protein
MSGSKRIRTSMIIAAVTLTILVTSLLSMGLALAHPPEVAWVGNHVGTILEKGVDNRVTGEGESHVANLTSNSYHPHKTTRRTNIPSNLDSSDTHAAVVSRWHRDSLRSRSRRVYKLSVVSHHE